MTLIKALLGLLFKLALAAALLAVVMWIIAVFFPQISFKNIAGYLTEGTSLESSVDTSSDIDGKATTTKRLPKSWLPVPGSWKLAGSGAPPAATDNVYVSNGPYVHGEAYNSTGSTYGTTYTSSSTERGDQRELYLRNLSLPSYGYIYSGMTIIGEAKDSMFAGGRFPIILVDNAGRSGVIAYAQATTNWAIPGWVRFEAKVTSRLPTRMPCTLIFRSESVQPIMKKPIQIYYPVQCQ